MLRMCANIAEKVRFREEGVVSFMDKRMFSCTLDVHTSSGITVKPFQNMNDLLDDLRYAVQ